MFFENIESSRVDEEFKNTMINEMKFIRAFIYFRLIRSYGGVPIIKEVYDEHHNIKFRKHKNLELNIFTYYIKFNSEKIKLRRD